MVNHNQAFARNSFVGSRNLSREDFDRLFKSGRAKIRKLELRYWWRKFIADPIYVMWFVMQNFKFIRFFTLDRGEP